MAAALRVIIVEPRYQINLGYIARVSKNFGVERLFIVNPRAAIGKSAIMYSKHARDLLHNAAVCSNLSEATKGCDMIVGTTGLWQKANTNFRRAYLIGEAVERASRAHAKTIGLLIGRDDTGLTKEEIERCDMIAYIGTNPAYPVLNISHALAVMLYAFTARSFKTIYAAPAEGRVDRNEMKRLISAFDSIVDGKRIRDRKAVKSVFRRMLTVSRPNAREVHALITALK